MRQLKFEVILKYDDSDFPTKLFVEHERKALADVVRLSVEKGYSSATALYSVNELRESASYPREYREDMGR